MKPSKLQKLLALSGSSNEHEAANAALMLAKGLREAGVDLEKALKRQAPRDHGEFQRGYKDGFAVGQAFERRKHERNREMAKETAAARARWHWENQAKRAEAAKERNARMRKKVTEEWKSWAWD